VQNQANLQTSPSGYRIDCTGLAVVWDSTIKAASIQALLRLDEDKKQASTTSLPVLSPGDANLGVGIFCGVQQVATLAQASVQAHHQTFPQRVNRRVGHLRFKGG
jgi:hypothetical protein